MSHRRFTLFLLAWGLFCATCVFAASIPRPSIAFAAEHDGGLYFVDHSSPKLHKVYVGLKYFFDLTYSHSRRQLAFTASKHHGIPRSLYVLSVDGMQKQLLFDARTNNYELYRPKFDPTGQFLYALNYSEGVFRYSFRTKRWSKVAILGRDDIHPQGLGFSVTGTRVALSHDKFVGFLIASVTSEGIRVEREILAEFNSVTSPQWLDDDTIVFAGRKVPGLQFLWRIRLSSGIVDQLTAAPLGARDFLTLSSDSKSVVFTGTNDQEPLEWRLWQLALDGSEPTQLTKGGRLSFHLFPTWIE